MIDFPGAPRLHKLMDQHPQFGSIDCFIYVIDSSKIRTNTHDIALFLSFFQCISLSTHSNSNLIDLLLNPTLSQRNVPIIIAFNKLDLAFRKNINEIKSEEDEESDKPKTKSPTTVMPILKLTEQEEKLIQDWVSDIEHDMFAFLIVLDDHSYLFLIIIPLAFFSFHLSVLQA